MKKIKQFLKLIFFFNFKFFPPLKKNLLLWDCNGEDILKRLINKNCYEILYKRYETINLFILFKSIIKYKSLKKKKLSFRIHKLCKSKSFNYVYR